MKTKKRIHNLYDNTGLIFLNYDKLLETNEKKKNRNPLEKIQLKHGQASYTKRSASTNKHEKYFTSLIINEMPIKIKMKMPFNL